MHRSLIALAFLSTAFALSGAFVRIEPSLASAHSIAVAPSAASSTIHFAALSAASSAPAAAEPARAPEPVFTAPTRLTIPSAGIDSPVIPVGLNKKGEMDVPDGETDNVGWYKAGTIPGQRGSAVLDAHVYAAFEDLRHVKVGDEILVENESGDTLRFLVEESTVYKLAELTSYQLFERNDARRLNLITCAGTFVHSMDTYSHRLVVYAVYAGIV